MHNIILVHIHVFLDLQDLSTSTPLQTKTTNRKFHNFDNLFAKIVTNHINKLPTICNSMKSATLRGDFVYLNFVVSFEAELDTIDNFQFNFDQNYQNRPTFCRFLSK